MILLNSKGVSLTELLIACMISSLMLSAVIRHFVSIKQSYRDMSLSSAHQAEKYVLSELLKSMIVGTGYFGCRQPQQPTPLKPYSILQQKNKALPQVIQKQGSPSSDVLYLSTISDPQSNLSKDMQVSNMLNIEEALGLVLNDQVVIADCHRQVIMALHKVSNNGKRLYFKQKTKHLFDHTSQLGLFEERYLYVKKRGGLFIKLGRHRSEALSEQVTQMKLHEVQYAKHPLIHIHLHFERGDALEIDVAVRNAS